MSNSIKVGQIYRDTYFDGLNAGTHEHRTIRILEIIGDKVRAETLTGVLGNILPKPRRTTISFKTLASGYVLVSK